MGMDSFFNWLLFTSLAGCIITLVILLVKIMFGCRMSAGWHYSIWFLLIIKLVVPFAPTSSFSIFSMLNYLTKQFPAQITTVEKVHHYLSSSYPRQADNDPKDDYSISVSRHNRFSILFFIWLAGVGVFTVYLILQNRKTVKLLKDKQPIDDKSVIEVFEICKKEMRIKADIRLLSTDGIQIPALYGQFSPVLLLPEGVDKWLSSEQLKHVFFHELAHYKRKDFFINVGLSIIQIIHWFNPVIAFAFNRMRQEREAATDSLALSYLNPKEHQSYGTTIIRFLSHIRSSENTTALAFLTSKTDIKRRIANIATYRQGCYAQRLWGVVLSIFISCFVLTNASALPQTGYYPEKLANMERVDLTDYFQDVEGSFVLLDQDQNKYTVYNETKSRERVSPDSTFKIYAALIGLEYDILHNADTQLKWDKTIYPVNEWNQNHTLRSAMTYSVNWYFDEVNRRIGEDRMRVALRRINYGNADISAGIKDFWIESSLKISPLEQVEQLRKLDNYRLPFAHSSIDTVKKVIKISEHNGNVLFGKTGTGTVNQHNIRGWFIGYVSKKGHRYYFATYIQDNERADGKKAKDITLKILTSKSLY